MPRAPSQPESISDCGSSTPPGPAAAQRSRERRIQIRARIPIHFRIHPCLATWLARLILIAASLGTGRIHAAAPPAITATNTWWATQPLARPAIPTGARLHPIDALATRSGPLAASPDRRTLLRRLMVDLHGLLPTPEEVAAFEADPAPDAFERQVDRLLTSPRYGERWARHWLDVVHFAETHGHDQDRPRESAWPYRDYLIESFNTDKPYARFVQEQIAADALFPNQPELTPALGFLAAGPWDESSLRDIREDSIDREIGRYLDRDDIVANVMATFTSVTAHCARCHDHKFDPVSQRDYYALQSVFAGTEKAERLYDLDPATHRTRQAWMRLRVALDRHDPELLEQSLTPSLRAEIQAWESGALSNPIPWTALPGAVQAQSLHGELALQPDGSFLITGPNPATNTYTLTAPAPDSTITAVRLEVLPDDSLPAHGPGRAENGNLHLTDFQLLAATNTAPRPGDLQAVPLARPSADFNQADWGIAKAIDSDFQSGWGIHPQEGRSHEAVFELDAPRAFPAGTSLRFVLRQDHGRQHTIGRFRLSVTDHAPPVRAGGLPPQVLAALKVDRAQRTPQQRFELAAHCLAGRVERELALLPEPRRVYAGASVFPVNAGQKPLGRPREVRVLRRGEITKPLEAASPGTLACVAGLPARFTQAGTTPADDDCNLPEESRRRAALARWLSDRDNPLVWRSIANRVWHQHFGHGIVATPNDFGRMGSGPGSPELLDWLAIALRDDFEGSLKMLHRCILTSATWRQQSADPQSARPLQPLGRRLDAETFRDSVLRIAGRLDDRMGGPSFKQFAMSEGIHVTPNVRYTEYDVDAPGGARRSIYRFLFRTLPDPFMDAMDSPPGDQSTPVRSESFTALQAFALLNHPFVTRQSAHIAARLRTAHAEPADQVRLACQLAWQREPTPDELRRFTEHAARHGLAHLCRVLLNSNEFHFLD